MERIHDLSKVSQRVREQLDLDKTLKEQISSFCASESHLIYKFFPQEAEIRRKLYTGWIYLITETFEGPVFYFSFGQINNFTGSVYKKIWVLEILQN